MHMASEDKYPRETTMRHFQYKCISTTVVVLSVAIISLGGNVSAGEKGYQQGFIGMDGVVSQPPTQNYRQRNAYKYQQHQPSGNTSTNNAMRCCRINEYIACKYCPTTPGRGAMKYKSGGGAMKYR
jgi:hypothetical protein